MTMPARDRLPLSHRLSQRVAWYHHRYCQIVLTFTHSAAAGNELSLPRGECVHTHYNGARALRKAWAHTSALGGHFERVHAWELWVPAHEAGFDKSWAIVE